MAIKKEAYLYLSAALRARETKLLNAERAQRMLDAAGFEECAKLLNDCGYSDMSQFSAKEIEAELSRRRCEVFDELERMAPDRAVVDIFRMKYDYHNVRSVLKGDAVGADCEHLLVSCGRVKPERLLSAIREERWSELPKALAKAAEDAKAALARTGNPQLADFVLDKAYSAELRDAAKATGSPFLTGYVDILGESTRLKSAVRILRMGRGAETMLEAGVSDGNDRFAAGDRESIAAKYSRTLLEKAAALGMDALDGGSLTAFELECDNAVNAYLKGAKLVSFGEEPLVAYIAAVENEITAIRMILTGRLAGIAPATIRERLRDLYA